MSPRSKSSRFVTARCDEHQDSEKNDAMVGLLVVGLPSVFKGGALEVRHGGETATYRGRGRLCRSSRSTATAVTTSRRSLPATGVVLTYNLLLRGKATRSAVDPDPELVDGLARCFDEHFAAADGPDRLVYLLDHEYTRRGLDSSRLKGADGSGVPPLRAAAERAGATWC